MKKTAEILLSSYERALLNDKDLGIQKQFIENEKIKMTLNAMLNTKVSRKAKDGTTITASAIELMVASAVSDAIDKGSFAKLKDCAVLAGEKITEQTSNVNLNLVDKNLLERAIKWV